MQQLQQTRRDFINVQRMLVRLEAATRSTSRKQAELGHDEVADKLAVRLACTAVEAADGEQTVQYAQQLLERTADAPDVDLNQDQTLAIQPAADATDGQPDENSKHD